MSFDVDDRRTCFWSWEATAADRGITIIVIMSVFGSELGRVRSDCHRVVRKLAEDYVPPVLEDSEMWDRRHVDGYAHVSYGSKPQTSCGEQPGVKCRPINHSSLVAHE